MTAILESASDCVDRHRGFGIAERFRCLRFAQRGCDRQVSTRFALVEGVESRASLRRVGEPKLGKALVIRRVVGKRRRRQRRVGSRAGGLPHSRLPESRRAVNQRLIRRECAFAHVVVGRHQPQLTRGCWQRRMNGRRECSPVARTAADCGQSEDQGERKDSRTIDHR